MRSSSLRDVYSIVASRRHSPRRRRGPVRSRPFSRAAAFHAPFERPLGASLQPSPSRGSHALLAGSSDDSLPCSSLAIRATTSSTIPGSTLATAANPSPHNSGALEPLSPVSPLALGPAASVVAAPTPSLKRRSRSSIPPPPPPPPPSSSRDARVHGEDQLADASTERYREPHVRGSRPRRGRADGVSMDASPVCRRRV